MLLPFLSRPVHRSQQAHFFPPSTTRHSLSLNGSLVTPKLLKSDRLPLISPQLLVRIGLDILRALFRLCNLPGTSPEARRGTAPPQRLAIRFFGVFLLQLI